MSQNEEFVSCIAKLKEVMGKIESRKQICFTLVEAMSKMDCPVSRAEYFFCFNTNENLRNEKIKDVTGNIPHIVESVYLHCGQQNSVGIKLLVSI